MARASAIDAFLARFLLPLVRGGELHVGNPLGRKGLDRLGEQPPDPLLDAELADARAAVCRELLLDPIVPQLDHDTLRLAVAVHDLLFLFHPAASVFPARGRIEEIARWAARCAALDETTDPDELVARHSVLHQLPHLGRTDTRVTFWVGKREFHGAEPPKRLTAWPNLRRVRQEKWRVSCFSEAASHPHGAEALRALLDASPLTDLLNPVRIEPALDLTRHVGLLGVAPLCRAVAYAWLEELDRAAPAIAAACLHAVDATSQVGDADERLPARFACALLAHLHLCILLAAVEPTPRERRAGPARLTTSSDPQVRDFYGLFAALDLAAPELAAPPDVRHDARLARRLGDHVVACIATCGAARTAELRALITRKLEGEVPLLAS